MKIQKFLFPLTVALTLIGGICFSVLFLIYNELQTGVVSTWKGDLGFLCLFATAGCTYAFCASREISQWLEKKINH